MEDLLKCQISPLVKDRQNKKTKISVKFIYTPLVVQCVIMGLRSE